MDDPTPALPFSERVDADGRAVLALRGCLGSDTAASLREVALRVLARSQDVTLDCTALEQVGGAALQVLLALHQEVRQKGGALTVEGLDPALARGLALAGVTPALLPA